MIASTHNLSLIESFTHAVVLQNGIVVEEGEIKALEKQKGHFFRYKTRQSGLHIDRKGRAHIAADRLKQLWLFATAPIISLEHLAELFTTRRCKSGEVVLQEGEDADRLCVVVTGQVESKSRTSSTTMRMIYQSGDEIGVDGMLDSDTRV